jgi:hypothetical protein
MCGAFPAEGARISNPQAHAKSQESFRLIEK